jgi:Uma2 family endonuclease
MPLVPEHIVEWRRRTGADRWDEMWDGVLHMPPAPNRDHRDLVLEIVLWLRERWAAPGGHRVHIERNVCQPGGWPSDYRVPDAVLLASDRFALDKNKYIEGPPTVVVEVRSPDDETYDKLAFYRQLKVPEVWIIDRDTRAPEVYSLAESEHTLLASNSDGWIASRATTVELRRADRNQVMLRIAGEMESQCSLPEPLPE